MKRIGYLYEKIYEKDNIELALKKASRGKTHKPAVKQAIQNKQKTINHIHEILKNKTYVPNPYFEAIINDGMNKKQRTIFKPKFNPDQIIHWCLMLVINQYLIKSMYHWNCASIPERGTHYAKGACEKWIRTDFKNTKYCLKLDIKKYYPSIDKVLLKDKFRRKFKDVDLLWLIDSIIDSHHTGLPIGNYTSQWFANFYLQDVDYYIKQELDIKYYIRYMDDLVLFSSNKRKLKRKFKLLEKKLNEEGLQVKGNWQIFNVSKRNLDFCGFVFKRNKTFVRKRITKNMRRKAIYFKKKPTRHLAFSLLSYYGWLKHTDSYVLYKKYYNMNKLKEMIK